MAEIAIGKRSCSRFGLSLPLLMGVAVYAPLLFAAPALLGDPDTYWHIATGRWIMEHGAVPDRDVFSFSMPGAPWTPPEWLAEIVIARLYDHFGWAGLVMATAASVAGALAILLRALLGSLAPVHALIATVLAAMFVIPHLLARPHILVLPILVWWVAALVAARTENRAPSWLLVPLMTLWANMHSSYALGLGLATLLAGEALLLAADRQTRLQALRSWGFFIALSIAASLVTPFGIDGLLLPFKLTTMSTLGLIKEWQSPNFEHFEPLEIWIIAVLFAALWLGWRLPPTRVMILLLLLHMALRHGRYGELLGFLAPLIVAPALGLQIAKHLTLRPLSALDRAMSELAKPASPRGIAIAGAALLAVSAVALWDGAAREASAITPKAAVAAVAARHLQGPVFNDYAFGGYLVFAGIEPFIDGRYFYGDAFIKRYVDATLLLSGELPQLLAEYGIVWTLLTPRNPAVVLLDHLPGWRRFYTDDIAVVHVHEDQLGADNR